MWYYELMTRDQVQIQIDSIKNQLVKKYKPEKIILFGSAASGNMTADSDLDFFIIKNEKKDPYQRMVEVSKLIERDMAVDFIIYTPGEFTRRLKLGDPFMKMIMEEGRILYG